MNPRLIETFSDFELFAPEFFKIIPKQGGAPTPFHLNSAQRFVHRRLEDQKKETGKVRAIGLKGRQQGFSTLIQGRYFYIVITSRGVKAYILTHEADATSNLFDMTKRYYELLPPGLCYEAEKSNAKKLHFAELGSGYAIGTAGNKGTGRSQTIQLFHGSEVAYWPNAEEHAAGVLEAVGNAKGTEIILESTANGIGNYFHQMWMSACSGESEYQAIFVPWFWQDEYRMPLLKGWRPNDDESELLEIYAKDGMTLEHLAWRRQKLSNKISDIEEALSKFKQEYPCSPDEAFQNPIDNIFINSRCVMAARSNDVESDSSLIVGVDPAIGDNDRTAIIRRRGRLAYKLQTLRNHNTMEVAGVIVRIIQEERPVKVYIDCIGIGAGIVDRLQEMGYHFVEGVNVARTANDKERFGNLRAELWSEMRDWLLGELPVQIPDDDALHADLCSLGFKHRSNGQLLLESKEQLKKRGLPSCDTADALMLTFYAGQYAGDLHYQPETVLPQHQSQFY
jgi:hypothetical protein